MVMGLNDGGNPAVLGVVGLIAGLVGPLLGATPSLADQGNFTDVGDNYWARPFIESLAAEQIIAGFPDGSFKPDQAVTRAQFAAILKQAFDQPETRANSSFVDVSSDYWASAAIAEAYRQGFLSGYPDGTFAPEQQIPRVQVLVSLTNGLQLNADGSISQDLSIYRDADQVPAYAEDEVAAATERAMVVNYPNIDTLEPNQVATRADVAAFIYQALVNQGQMPALQAGLTASHYIVGFTGSATPQTSSLVVSSGTQIPVRYPDGNDVSIVAAPGQTVATTLEVADSIRNGSGQVLIPSGSLVQGRVIPVNIQGANITAAKFVADSLTIDNHSYRINAESSAIAATDQVDASTLQGALITSAAESILGSLTGNRGLGTLVGAIISGDNRTTSQNAVIVIDPTQLDLMVQSEFTVASVADN